MKATQQTLFADMPAQEERSKAHAGGASKDVVQVVSVYQPYASLMACGAQWLYVSPMKLGRDCDIAVLAKWPAWHQLKIDSERHQVLLNQHGLKRYADLPQDAIIATGEIVSRKRIPYRNSDPQFWDIIQPQLHLVPQLERGWYAYRVKLDPIHRVPFETKFSTFKISRFQLEG